MLLGGNVRRVTIILPKLSFRDPPPDHRLTILPPQSILQGIPTSSDIQHHPPKPLLDTPGSAQRFSPDRTRPGSP